MAAPAPWDQPSVQDAQEEAQEPAGEPDPIHTANHEADMEWARMRSRRGFSPESLNMLLQEFVRKQMMSVAWLKWIKARR